MDNHIEHSVAGEHPVMRIYRNIMPLTDRQCAGDLCIHFSQRQSAGLSGFQIMAASNTRRGKKGLSDCLLCNRNP